MKKKLLAMMALCAGALLADLLPAPMQVYPTPQEVTLGDETFHRKPDRIAVDSQATFDTDALRVLARSFEIADSAPFRLTWTRDAALKQEGYTLKLTANGVTVTAADEAGLYYAMQTLRQLVASGKFRTVSIRDWPAIAFRGTVEGFYGLPWSFESRKSQFRFYGDTKLNTYIYGPKDDPFHGFSNRWRDPYPAEQAEKIAELVRVAHENKVNFVWAVHPGRDIHWNTDADIKACVAKFEMMYKLGVRSFAVFFDDIGGEGARAEMQVKLLNYVNRNFVRVKKDVTPLLICPTQYNRAWSGGPYLEILGKGLDADINVMWTGNSVCTDITREGMEWINKKLGRKAYIWWNWPVSDYCRPHLLLGKSYGNSADNGPLCSGFVSNPMDKPEASKIGLFGLASYTWNPANYNADTAWRTGITRLFPEVAAAVQVFADHNSDQGPNGHGYRREESVTAEPIVKRALAALKNGKAPTADDTAALRACFAAMQTAADDILGKCTNRLFLNEVSDWLKLFREFGAIGTTLCDALAGRLSAEAAYMKLLTYHERHEQISAEHAKKPFQTKIVVATRVMVPFINAAGEHLYNGLWHEVAGCEPPKASPIAAYEFITNVPAYKNLKVQRDGMYVRLPRIFETKTLKPGEYVGIRLPAGVTATWLHFILGNNEATARGRVQLSRDGGKTWDERSTVLRGNGKAGEVEVRHINPKDGINACRFINTSKQPLTLTFEQFKLDVPADAAANVPESMTDGNAASYYTIPAGQTVTVTLRKPATDKTARILALGPYTAEFAGNTVKITAGTAPVRIFEIVH